MKRWEAVREHPARWLASAIVATVIFWFGVAPATPVVAAGLTVWIWVHAIVKIRRRAVPPRA